MKSIINSYLKTELKILERKTLKKNTLPLSYIQYDEKDIQNSLKTLLRGWPTIGMEVKKV